jgi:Xaa-Pro aminopeptidase
MTEWDVRRILRRWTDDLDAENESFRAIVAVGSNASRCHAVPGPKVLRKGQPLLIDMGALVKGYHSDMTRTVFLGNVSKRMKDLYKIVLSAQMKAIEKMRDGATGAEVDRAARSVIKRHGYGKNFGHGLGHGVGLDIHENPFMHEKSEAVLRSGMVITVEPGIYLPGVGGIRIEDVVLIKRNGCEVLTRTPKELRVLDV